MTDTLGPLWAERSFRLRKNGKAFLDVYFDQSNMTTRTIYAGVVLLQPMKDNPYPYLRALKQESKQMLNGWTVIAYVDEDEKQNLRFAEFFGFRPCGPGPYPHSIELRRNF